MGLEEELNLVKLELKAEHVGKRARYGRHDDDFHDVLEQRVHREARDAERALELFEQLARQLQHLISQRELLLLVRLVLHAAEQVDLQVKGSSV